MADSDGEAPTAAAIQPELNLADIKELLVDIQITVATILRENLKLKRISINENLTNYRRELSWKANKMKKDNMITSTWTMDGKIFVKTSPSRALVRIHCDEDLDDL